MPETDPNFREPRLSRALFGCIAEANRLINLENEGAFEYLPSYDGYQAPQNVAGDPEESERKRPDFIWSLHDHAAASGLEGCREFVVECKRLGDPPGQNTLNHRYVDLGIVRFVSPRHKYGMRGASGAMVGYVQRSNKRTILAVVQARAATHALAAVVPYGTLDDAILELEQLLERTFGESPFRLHHFWVMLRLAPVSSPGSSPQEK